MVAPELLGRVIVPAGLHIFVRAIMVNASMPIWQRQSAEVSGERQRGGNRAYPRRRKHRRTWDRKKVLRPQRPVAVGVCEREWPLGRKNGYHKKRAAVIKSGSPGLPDARSVL
jgi:hypothetical protein